MPEKASETMLLLLGKAVDQRLWGLQTLKNARRKVPEGQFSTQDFIFAIETHFDTKILFFHVDSVRDRLIDTVEVRNLGNDWWIVSDSTALDRAYEAYKAAE